MGLHDKVLWEEGMFLGPQHFQQWDRHHAHELDRRMRALQAHFWGLTALQFDEDALVGGELRLPRVSGVFRDGTLFDAPDVDALPAARNAAEAFDPGMPGMGVFVAVPAARVGSMVGDAGAGSQLARRYSRETVMVVDEAKGALEREIAAGHLNLRLLFEGEPQENFEVLQIARLLRGATGGLVLDAEFVPSCLAVAAAPAVGRILRRTAELLSSKSDELTQKRGDEIGGTVQFGGDAASFLLLHTVNSYLPLVAHHNRHQSHHPEHVYRDLAGFVGALCAFYTGNNPETVPPYDHADLSGTFRELERQIDRLRLKIAPERSVPVPLHQESEDSYSGRISEELLANSDFYLAVKASVPPQNLVQRFPDKAKISSSQQLEYIRTRMVRGVKLVHLERPPSEIKIRTGFQYFELAQDGGHWEAVRETRTLAIYVPPEFTDLELECKAVKRDS